MTIPDTAIEAAARALGEHRMGRKLDATSVLDLERATAALTAAYPHMEAQAKAEALRDAAYDIERETPTARYWAGGYLRARANNLEGKDS